VRTEQHVFKLIPSARASSKEAASQHRRPRNNRAGTACLQQTQPHHGASQFKLLQVPSRHLLSIAAAALAAAITAAAVAAGAAAAVALHTGVWGGGERGAAIVRLKQSCRERGRQCNTCNTQPGMSGRVRVVQPPHMPQSSLQAP